LKTRFITWLPALVVMATIFTASSLHGEEVPLPDFFGSDKVAHLSIYALLGFALSWRDNRRSLKNWDWQGLILGWLYGASDEIHQIFVPGRRAGMDDWIADAMGIALALLITFAARRKAP
jgi:VanZ family protein